MGGVAETNLGIYLNDFTVAGFHQFIGFFKPSLYEPFLGCEVAYFLEIALESGEAAPGVK